MEQIELRYHPLTINGYLNARLPSKIISEIDSEINTAIKNNFQGLQKNNVNLFGAIEHEYLVPINENLKRFILELCKKFWLFEYNYEKANKKHTVRDNWINFQKKYEHNPIHLHTGDLSYVIWHKIPYDIEEEKNIPSVKNSNEFQKNTANFCFVYPYYNNYVKSHTISMTKQVEGNILVFKSSLQHIVYPFYTSDEYRISLSGNVYIEDE